MNLSYETLEIKFIYKSNNVGVAVFAKLFDFHHRKSFFSTSVACV